MKIDKDTFETMRTEINKAAENMGGWSPLVDRYEAGNFPRAEKVKDLQTRFCFDMYYGAPGLNAKICMLPGVNDAHILTALKAICPKLIRKY